MKQIDRVVAAALAGGVMSIASAQDPVQWRVVDGGNGHWYQGIPGIISWTDARSDSLAAGGDLVSLDEPGEFQALIDHVLDPNRKTMFHPENDWGPHIGGIQSADAPDHSEPDGGWSWLSGVAIDCNADPCNLDNCCGGQDRLALASVPMGSFTYSFNDTTPSAATAAQPGYVIEWSADCNADGIVDYGQILDGTLTDDDGDGVPECCDAGNPCSDGAVQWRVEDGGNGHWYAGVDYENQIELADCFVSLKQIVESDGAHLATLTTAEESTWVHQNVSSVVDGLWEMDPSNLHNYGPIIGAEKVESQWTWVTGEPWGYACWNSFEPSGDGNYVILWSRYSTAISTCMNDVSCSYFNRGKAIIEWSADCNDDGIVDYGQILDGTFDDEDMNGVPDVCETCVGDLDDDDAVGASDLGILLAAWGTDGGSNTRVDINGDGTVSGADLAYILSYWGFDCGD